ncbi:MAG: ATP synthase F1 subunit epsilon [Oxalobacteraceae bacterium]|nr:ATP synthase F1 subunit epsilon [Oxalobacteraceae bacterium]
MANTIQVDVVSAEEQIYSGPAEFVALPGEAGELGIYPKHTPLITRIKPGAVRIRVPGQAEEEFVFVAGGILEVQPRTVTVMADTRSSASIKAYKKTSSKEPARTPRSTRRAYPPVYRPERNRDG